MVCIMRRDLLLTGAPRQEKHRHRTQKLPHRFSPVAKAEHYTGNSRTSRAGCRMRRTAIISGLILSLAVGVTWAASTINPAVPTQGSTLSSSVVRNNFAAAANDINALQSSVSTLQSGSLQKSNNLSDVADAPTSRTNLGLAAIAASGSASDLTAGTLPAGRFPALTGGDCTSLAGSLSVTCSVSGMSGTLPVAHGGTNATSASGTALDNITGFASTGAISRTGAGTYAFRTLTAPAAGITVSNGDGVSGNPTLALANDLSAVEGLSGTGLAARTATDTWTTRTVTAGTGITVTNGDGVSGNPTIAIDTSVVKGGLIGVQVFTAGGTYTPTSGTVTVEAEICGAGGGGGGVPTTAAGQFAGGGGGAAGGWAWKRAAVATFSGQTVTIGAAGTNSSGSAGGTGGTTSIGAVMSATGGAGGAVGSAAGAAGVNVSSAAGVGSGGDLNGGGTPGLGEMQFGATAGMSGTGGSLSPYGSGGNGTAVNGGAGNNGAAATGHCSGGAGAASGPSQAATRPGGAATGGLAIFREYN